MTKYFNVYGAKYNKDKSRVNITLINSKGDEKEYATISLKVKDNNMLIVKEQGIYLGVKFLKDFENETEKKEKKTKSKSESDTDKSLPF